MILLVAISALLPSLCFAAPSAKSIVAPGLKFDGPLRLLKGPAKDVLGGIYNAPWGGWDSMYDGVCAHWKIRFDAEEPNYAKPYCASWEQEPDSDMHYYVYNKQAINGTCRNWNLRVAPLNHIEPICHDFSHFMAKNLVVPENLDWNRDLQEHPGDVKKMPIRYNWVDKYYLQLLGEDCLDWRITKRENKLTFICKDFGKPNEHKPKNNKHFGDPNKDKKKPDKYFGKFHVRIAQILSGKCNPPYKWTAVRRGMDVYPTCSYYASKKSEFPVADAAIRPEDDVSGWRDESPTAFVADADKTSDWEAECNSKADCIGGGPPSNKGSEGPPADAEGPPSEEGSEGPAADKESG